MNAALCQPRSNNDRHGGQRILIQGVEKHLEQPRVGRCEHRGRGNQSISTADSIEGGAQFFVVKPCGHRRAEADSEFAQLDVLDLEAFAALGDLHVNSFRDAIGEDARGRWVGNASAYDDEVFHC